MRKFAKWFLIRLPIAFIILGVVFAITLKMVERYPDSLKDGFEEFLSQATQTSATITTVNEIKFFPTVELDLADITFHELDNAAITNLSVRRVALKLPFWSSIIGARRLDYFNVENLRAKSEAILPYDLTVTKAEIVDFDGPDRYGSFLIADGKYRDEAAKFEIKMKKLEQGYKLPKSLEFSLTIGAYQLNGELVKNFSSTKIENAVFQKGSVVSNAKNYDFFDKDSRNTENPLSCIIDAEKLEECDIYLENNKEE